MALFKGGLKIKVTKEDALKSIVLILVAGAQGAAGILASYLVTYGLAFDAQWWNKLSQMWFVGCWAYFSNSYWVQLAWYPSSVNDGIWGPVTHFTSAGGCIQTRLQVNQAVAWGAHVGIFVLCLCVVIMALTASKKKLAAFIGLAIIPMGFAWGISALLLNFIVDNGCSAGGLAWRWHNLAFAMSSGKVDVKGKDTDIFTAGRYYSWPEAGYPVPSDNPKCYWAVELMNGFFPVVPLIFCVYAGLAVYIGDKKYVEMLKFTGPFFIYMGVFCLYGVYGPRIYIDEKTTDDDRVILRVLAHPALMEAMAVPFRSVGKNLTSVSLRIAYLFFPCKTTTLYSRFLVNAVSDQTLLVISSVALGGVEILMRTTVHQRDKLSQIVMSKLTGRKFTSFDRAFLMEYKCSLVVVEMIFELADIFTMAGLFSLMCQPGGPLRQGVTIDSGNSIMRGAGFKIEDFIIENALLQVLIEVAVSLCCLVLEISLGFPVLQVVRKGYFLPFFLASTSFGFLYSTWFMNSIFQFPMLDFLGALKYTKTDHLMTDPYAEVHLPQFYYDLYWTWIYYVPTGVERAYQKQWAEEAFG